MGDDSCTKSEARRPKTASGLLVYLMEELGDARLRCAQLKKYIHDATELIEKSEHRDHFFEVAGNLIYGVPDTLMKLDKALDATALAAARLDYEEIKNGLRPEKADELESALEETRLRYLNRRSAVSSRNQLLDYMLNGLEHASNEAEVMADLTGWGFDKGFAKDLYATWMKERPDLKSDLVQAEAHARKLVDQIMHKHHVPANLPKTAATDHELFKFRCPAPITHLYEVAGRLKDRGIQAEAGTEHIYGTVEAKDADEAAAKLNQAAGFKLARPSEIHKSAARKESAPMNAKSAAYFLNKIADLTDKQGRVPVAAVMHLVAKLEKGDKRAATLSTKASSAFRNIAKEIAAQEHPSRIQIASILRRIVGDTLQVAIPTQQVAQQPQQAGQQQQQQAVQQQPLAGAGEDFQKANPKITDEEAKVIDEMHDENKDVVKGK